MSKTYDDIIDAMTTASQRDSEVEQVVLTQNSINSFITDSKFNESTEEKSDELGEWSIDLVQGDDNYLLLENGSEIRL